MEKWLTILLNYLHLVDYVLNIFLGHILPSNYLRGVICVFHF